MLNPVPPSRDERPGDEKPASASLTLVVAIILVLAGLAAATVGVGSKLSSTMMHLPELPGEPGTGSGTFDRGRPQRL